ncbi:hypothetical protein CC86DRAFT_178345 [Ophiobolus disseminans]|uniref:BTB domain-containing protein n=1 Tax=Ophiobolus disseminans TaxID=1469910 RepID=A0A6A7AB82_9PLEO|nr:hypothetical protein CC86DRAFT_178345 [Ophiobolus disseminans]
MVATRGTAAATGREPTPQPTGNGPINTLTTLFGGGEHKNDTVPARDLKRKATDPKLDIVTIDKMHDLTLLVGSPGTLHVQKAFRVNKGSLRNASSVWAAMLNGNWAESGMSEISFPEDSSYAFEIVLRIVHLQFKEVPGSLTPRQLLLIAGLADKYDLSPLLHATVEYKKWLAPYRGSGPGWPANIDLQDFTLITETFGLEEDFQYLVNRLAMQVQLEKDQLFYMSSLNKKVLIRADFPARILGRVNQKRSNLLEIILKHCKTTLHATLEKKSGRCGFSLCPMTQAGIIMKTFHNAGLSPLPDNDSYMNGSVLDYWEKLKLMGEAHKTNMPAACKTVGTMYNPYTSSYVQGSGGCIGDIDIASAIQKDLKGHAHAKLWAQWEADKVV